MGLRNLKDSLIVFFRLKPNLKWNSLNPPAKAEAIHVLEYLSDDRCF
jgi:hypothetical protein